MTPLKRQNFTPKTKRLIKERSGGSCEIHLIDEASRKVRYPLLPETCERKAVDVDHINPAWSGGKPTLENGAHLCKLCHGIKTVTDNKEAKKHYRRIGQTGQRARRDRNGSRMQSRGFQKHPNLKRTVTGEVVKR